MIISRMLSGEWTVHNVSRRYGGSCLQYTGVTELEQAGTHKSAKTHAGMFQWLVNLTFDVLTHK